VPKSSDGPFPLRVNSSYAKPSRASRGEVVRFETLVRLREGMDLPLEVMITPHRDKDHHVVGTDITVCKRAEAGLQLVWIARPDGSISYNNQRLIDYLAMTLEQVKGNGWMGGYILMTGNG
jgi:hypothetical protein